jgi:hypothetical protein
MMKSSTRSLTPPSHSSDTVHAESVTIRKGLPHVAVVLSVESRSIRHASPSRYHKTFPTNRSLSIYHPHLHPNNALPPTHLQNPHLPLPLLHPPPRNALPPPHPPPPRIPLPRPRLHPTSPTTLPFPHRCQQRILRSSHPPLTPNAKHATGAESGDRAPRRRV